MTIPSPPERSLHSAQEVMRAEELQEILAAGFVGVLGYINAADEALKSGGCTEATVREAREHLTHARNRITSDRAAVRDVIDDLSWTPLGSQSLKAALQHHVDEAASIGGFACTLTVTGSYNALDKSLTRDVYAVAVEAINNIAQHAQASSIRVGLLISADTVALMVEDDGRGFNVDKQDMGRNLGIRRMKERIFERGGSFSLTSDPGWGTSLRARFPVTRKPNHDDAPVKVLIVEQRPALRTGLGTLMERTDSSISVVGELASVAEARGSARTIAPNVAMVGLGFLDETPQLIATLRQEIPELPIVVVSTPFTKQDLLDEAFNAGAGYCVDAAEDGAALVNAVTAAVRGSAAHKAVRLIRPDLRRDNALTLTPREREVRALIEDGLTDRDIAERLVISVKTVEKHVSSLFRKVGVRNRMQLLLEQRIDGQGNVMTPASQEQIRDIHAARLR